MSAAVSFTGVSRSFGRTRALADVSFQVPENSVCALLGPNGAGKTTAIRALLGLARTDAGEISVLGERPGSLAARSRLGYLPDVPAFPAWMTAREYLEASARLAGVPASTAGRRIDALLETAGLSSVRQRIGGYSRGSGSASPRRSSAHPVCSCSTSRPRRSTRRGTGRSWSSSNASRGARPSSCPHTTSPRPTGSPRTPSS